ncbi:MAG: small multi-drug export protein [Deltaproteobacteria bacterium]|jgi:uncharacterized membrane protein|nr:small multi-drug export protein [Deltaproteobacteria bacterium]MBT4384349.1 small multi-drug export protein [Candidatus Peregrinibacteria bacterium]MBT4632275.1 small multi-drug export protein [Candidatus Peregrinibacteria bacterium]MBT5516619.1 small multi-drug export protein [Candidatus Peregrinibacteria bacterium]MBT5824314.1 small multi-drug export protein [Candidatus Peregrinibacteria bacterium]
MPHELTVFILGMMPIIESRLAIPFGIGALGMNPINAFIFAIAGNFIAVIILLRFLDPVTQLLCKSSFLKKHIDWLFERTRTKHDKRMSELGHLALLIFVAIPIPGSGAWAGSLVAYLFDLKKPLATVIITCGLIIAGVIITSTTEGVISLF